MASVPWCRIEESHGRAQELNLSRLSFPAISAAYLQCRRCAHAVRRFRGRWCFGAKQATPERAFRLLDRFTETKASGFDAFLRRAAVILVDPAAEPAIEHGFELGSQIALGPINAIWTTTALAADKDREANLRIRRNVADDLMFVPEHQDFLNLRAGLDVQIPLRGAIGHQHQEER